MRVIGVDPGTLCTGYGVIDYKNDTLSIVKSGVIKPPSTLSIPLRLKDIYSGLQKVITETLPDEFAIETAFYGKNIQSSLKIGQARGVALLAAVNQNLEPFEYSPREIKKSVTGKGSAAKEQVLFMVQKLTNTANKKFIYDESDAVAIAICHALKAKSPVAKYSDWGKFIKDNPQRIIG